MNKVWTILPALCRCGYSDHAREIIESLEKIDDVEIMTSIMPWGNVGFEYEGEYKDKVLGYAANLGKWVQENPKSKIDLVIHLSVPNEFQKQMDCKYIGVTAGIEANCCHPDWIMKVNQNCDHLVVPSNFTKRIFQETQVIARDERTGQEFPLKLQKPITVIPESVDVDFFNEKIECKLDINFEPEFCFFSIGQWGNGVLGEERKNIGLLIKWFKEAFKGNEKVGLVLKTNTINTSLIDRQHTINKINDIIDGFNLRGFPKVYLIHDYMSEAELGQLFRHPKIKAYISLSHGEGWGRNEINAIACDLPILTIDWSGNADFLKLGKYIRLEYEMVDVPKMHIGNLFYQGSKWASPIQEDTKRKMNRIVKSYLIPKEWAIDLGKKVRQEFNKERIHNIWKEFFISNKFIELNKGKDKLLETMEFE